MDANPIPARIKPLPDKREPLDFAATYSASDAALMKRGFAATSMEERWLIYLANDWLYFHHYRTRACIFWIRLEPTDSGIQVVESFVNRDTTQCRMPSVDQCRQMLSEIIDSVLLGRVEPPDEGRSGLR